MPQARTYPDRCAGVYNRNGLPLMEAVNRRSCPNICSVNDKGGVYYDSEKLSWRALFESHDDLEVKAGITHAKAVGPNLNNNFYYPGDTGYTQESDLDYTDVLTNVWGDDLCMLVNTNDAQDCFKYYNSETGEICAPAGPSLYLFGAGPRCSSAARDYGGVNDAISMDDTVWVSHCEDIPTCSTEINDCSRISLSSDKNPCITSFQYDELGMPRRCYITSSGMCVAPIESSQERVAWCSGFPQ